jgi:hypothetical protein
MKLPYFRLAAGAAAGAGGWIAIARVLPVIPEPFRVILALVVFTLGPGAVVTFGLTADLSAIARAWMACGAGVAASALLADLLARIGFVIAYPVLTSMLTGAAVAVLMSQPARDPHERSRIGWKGALVALTAAATGAVAFAHRLQTAPGEIAVFGDYDSVDLSYYAAITSELTHRVPPLAPFYSGHALNYSWYPQLLLAMVHRFGDAAILRLYFQLAWPMFLTIAAVCGFVFVSEIAGPTTACLAMLLILLGGDFSWIVAWFFRPDTYLWDWLLWPTNFLAPTMEVLHFSTWTPSLPVMFVGLFALARQLRQRDWRAGIVAALSFAWLVEFKPFAFAILVGGAVAAALVGRVGAAARRQLMTTAALSVLAAAPYLYQIASLYAESRSHLAIDGFLLPRTMAEKLNATAAIDRIANLAGAGLLHTALFAIVATAIFFAGGLGMRWIGVPRILRAAWSGASPDPSRERFDGSAIGVVLAWMVLAGAGLPFVLVTQPYHDTLQFYQTALYLMWIFAAACLVSVRGRRRIAAIAVTFALALPPSTHFLHDKWRDNPVHALAGATRGEQLIAEYLRTSTNRDRVVIMHDRPVDPSLLVILSERRSVLSWARYVTGSEERQAEVDAFFGSMDGAPDQALATLTKYGVTHVIVRRERDRVHPDVLARLKQVVGASDAVLYEVP